MKKLLILINNIIIKKTKYTEELIQYITDLKSIVNGDQKMAIIKIKEKKSLILKYLLKVY